MIAGIGVDIVETDRIRESVSRWGDRFLKKIFNDDEIDYCCKRKNMFQCLAARFAAKEALIKALSGPQPGAKLPGMKDITVVNHPSGKPSISLSGGRYDRHIINLAISHERHYAVAVVFVETREK